MKNAADESIIVFVKTVLENNVLIYHLNQSTC